MPVLPQLETSQSVFSQGQLGYQQINATPEAFGGIAAEGVRQLGQGMAQGATELHDMAMRQLNIQREVNANDTYVKQFMPQLREMDTKYLGLQGKDAVEQRTAYEQQAEQLRESIKGSITDPVAQRMFDQTATRTLTNIQDSWARYAGDQNKVYRQQVSNGMVATFQQNAAARSNDPIVFQAMADSIFQERLAHGLESGQPFDYIKAQVHADVSKMWENRIEMMSLNDPIGAQKLYRDNIDQIEPHAQYQLGRMLDVTTNAQYAATDGKTAIDNVFARPTTPSNALPQNFNAPVVKPYDQKHIDDIVAAVRKPSPYDDIFNQVGARYNIAPNELKLRAVAESGLNPHAVSGAGAVGLAQLMPATAKSLGVDPNNPQQAIDGMARLMVKAQSSSAGDTSKVDRAYYGGNTNAHGPNTDQYVANLGAVRSRLSGQSIAPLTVDEIQSNEANVETQARALAEQRRPGDAVYADHVVAEAQKNFARTLQQARAHDYGNMTQVLDAAVKGNLQSLTELPPQIRQLYAQLPGRDQLSVQQVFRDNMRAASGEYTPSNPQVFNDVQRRINLPAGDPNRITDPSQITPLIAKGLSYSDSQKLMTEMKDLNSPELNPFLKQVAKVKETAQKMLGTSMSQIALTHPEVAQEAGYRFGFALDQNIAAMRKAGKDPHVLFDPTSPNYVLSPSRVMSFMPSDAEVAARAAGANAPKPASTSAPPRLPGESPGAYLARVGVH